MTDTNVKLIRLLSGEELVAEVVSQDTLEIQLKNPVILLVQQPTGPQTPGKPIQPQVSLAPWSMFSDPTAVKTGIFVSKNVVVYVTKPQKELENSYRQAFSKIVLPGTGSGATQFFDPLAQG